MENQVLVTDFIANSLVLNIHHSHSGYTVWALSYVSTVQRKQHSQQVFHKELPETLPSHTY